MTSPTQPPATTPEVFAFNITPAFAAALAEFQANLPKIDKNKLVEVETADNKDDYDYSYATLDHVSEIVLPKLAAVGLSFTAYPGTGTGGRLSLRYFLLHKSGGYIGTEWPISSEAKGMRAVQNLGGLITYVRRYALQAASGVAAEMEDDDLRSAVKAEQETPATAKRGRATAARTDRAATNTDRRNAAARGESDEPPGDPETTARRNPNGPVTTGEQRKIFAQLRDIDPALAERGDEARARRLATVSGLVGRPLTSINDLTSGQAGELIEVLDIIIQAENPEAALTAAIEAARQTEPGGTPQS